MDTTAGKQAFQYPRQLDVWHNTVPRDVDILITHGPPNVIWSSTASDVPTCFPSSGELDHCLTFCPHSRRARLELVTCDDFQRACQAFCLMGGGDMNLFRVAFHWASAGPQKLGQRGSLLVMLLSPAGFRNRLKPDAIRVVV